MSTDSRTLKSLSQSEIQQVLKYHKCSEDVQVTFARNEVDGSKLDQAGDAEDFREVGVSGPVSRLLVSIVEDMRRNGVPKDWLRVRYCADTWAKAYEQFYQAQYLNSLSALMWLMDQAADGCHPVMPYLMVYLFTVDSNLPYIGYLYAALQREVLPRWLQSTDATELMHAQCIMGYCYAYGIGCDKDHVQAATWYRRSADLGHVDALVQLGCCYSSGHGVPKDATQAVSKVSCFRKAAEQGHAKGQCEYASCLVSLSADREEAILWLRKSVAQEYGPAIYKLKRMNVSLT